MAYKREFVKKQLEDIDKPYSCPTCPYCNGERDATVKFQENKPDPWTWWKQQLNSPKFTVAPMVDQSELPFRMLCRKYGATLAYTPMFHSRSFAESAEYRRLQFSTCPEDRPLFVQFCGHDADTVLAAARHVEKDCDAVDLNLGCPQGIARRGHYGSFLMEEWDLIHTIVHTLRVELAIPVTVKMRRFDQLDLTLKYARMLRDAGAHVIAVHGRTRIQKGGDTGMADMDVIAAVKNHISEVPVLANGNILTFADIMPNLEKTKCDSAMSAEALLWDPRLFADPERPVLTGRGFHMEKKTRLDAVDTAKEYLDFVTQYPVDLGMVKAHLFKILYHSFEVHQAFREELGRFECNSIMQAINDAAEKRQQEVSNSETDNKTANGDNKGGNQQLCAGGDDCYDAKPMPQELIEKEKKQAEVDAAEQQGEENGSPVNSVGGSVKSGGASSAKVKKSRRNHEDDPVFRERLSALYDFVSRCRKAEEECTFDGALDKKAAAAKKSAEKAAEPDDLFDEFEGLF